MPKTTGARKPASMRAGADAGRHNGNVIRLSGHAVDPQFESAGLGGSGMPIRYLSRLAVSAIPILRTRGPAGKSF
jgi:hypothetical protein